MVRYRNVKHGRIVERSRPDAWLEASAGWERLDYEPPQEPATGPAEQDEGSND